MKGPFPLFIYTLFSCLFFVGAATVFAEPQTESICNIGMVQGEKGRSCEVPIPSGCAVANFPGYDAPWTDVSKGGNTSCKFDQTKTDWKTTITGSCGPCKTDKCSARFSVMFTCSDSGAYKPQPRTIH